MLRITQMEWSDQLALLRLEGQVIAGWVEELRNLCEVALRQEKRVVVDLTGVSFLDRDGTAFLASLKSRKVALVNAQPFVAELLKSAGGQ